MTKEAVKKSKSESEKDDKKTGKGGEKDDKVMQAEN